VLARSLTVRCGAEGQCRHCATDCRSRQCALSHGLPAGAVRPAPSHAGLSYSGRVCAIQYYSMHGAPYGPSYRRTLGCLSPVVLTSQPLDYTRRRTPSPSSVHHSFNRADKAAHSAAAVGDAIAADSAIAHSHALDAHEPLSQSAPADSRPAAARRKPGIARLEDADPYTPSQYTPNTPKCALPGLRPIGPNGRCARACMRACSRACLCVCDCGARLRSCVRAL
jgi:hypothetical protein